MNTFIAVLRLLTIVFGFEVLLLLMLLTGPSILADKGLIDAETPSVEAYVRITPDDKGRSDLSNEETFILRNTSANDQKITYVRIDLSTAVITDLVFAPDNQDDRVLSSTPTGELAVDPGIIDKRFTNELGAGFEVLEMEIDPLDPGEEFQFSAGIIPGIPHSPGMNIAAKTSELDLMGSIVTVRFEDGTELTSQALHIPASEGESEALLRDGVLLYP
jgi:hypothetical protein